MLLPCCCTTALQATKVLLSAYEWQDTRLTEKDRVQRVMDRVAKDLVKRAFKVSEGSGPGWSAAGLSSHTTVLLLSEAGRIRTLLMC